MRIVIFGATGSIGMELVKQALEQGHTLTAFTRSPEKLASLQSKDLTIVQGDMLRVADVEKAVANHDVVLCAIGDGRKGIVRAAGTRNIIRAMEKAGIRRLICQTTLGLGDSSGNLNFFWRYIMFGWFLKKAFRDHHYQEENITGSQLDYTIVRPSAFTNGPVTHNYKIGFGGGEKGLKLKIARADVADFMLRQLHSNTWIRKAVSISY